MATYTTLAIVDDVNTCDCCGKSNLKSTVAMERDDGEVLHFGSVCATRHSGRDSKAIASEAVAALELKQATARREFNASVEEIECQARIALANKNRITPGKPFADFCRDAVRAAQAKRAEVAAKFNLAAYAI